MKKYIPAILSFVFGLVLVLSYNIGQVNGQKKAEVIVEKNIVEQYKKETLSVEFGYDIILRIDDRNSKEVIIEFDTFKTLIKKRRNSKDIVKKLEMLFNRF